MSGTPPPSPTKTTHLTMFMQQGPRPKQKKHVTLPEIVAFMESAQPLASLDDDDLPALIDADAGDDRYPFTLGPMIDPRVFDVPQPTPPIPIPSSVSKGRFD